MGDTTIKGFDVDEVLRGYITCALWAENDESRPDGGDPLDSNYGAEDLTERAKVKLREDVLEFLNKAKPEDLAAYLEHKVIDPSQGTVGDYLGHDLWLTRNGHGAGFWDRDDLPKEVGVRLSKLSEDLGERDLYVTDRGEIDVL